MSGHDFCCAVRRPHYGWPRSEASAGRLLLKERGHSVPLLRAYAAHRWYRPLGLFPSSGCTSSRLALRLANAAQPTSCEEQCFFDSKVSKATCSEQRCIRPFLRQSGTYAGGHVEAAWHTDPIVLGLEAYQTTPTQAREHPRYIRNFKNRPPTNRKTAGGALTKT